MSKATATSHPGPTPSASASVTPEWFRAQRMIFPELCYVTTIAVGFCVSVYRVGGFLIGKKREHYQVMRTTDGRGPGYEFWGHRQRSTGPHFFPTPEAACAAFVRAWLDWNGANTTETTR